MTNNDTTDIKIALAKLEQSSVITAEASRKNTESHTALNIQLIELIGTIKLTHAKYDLMIEGSVTTANTTSEELNKHLEYAQPILLRNKRFQDNIDAMIRGIFSKTGFVVMGIITLAVLSYLGVTPATLNGK